MSLLGLDFCPRKFFVTIAGVGFFHTEFTASRDGGFELDKHVIDHVLQKRALVGGHLPVFGADVFEATRFDRIALKDIGPIVKLSKDWRIP